MQSLLKYIKAPQQQVTDHEFPAQMLVLRQMVEGQAEIAEIAAQLHLIMKIGSYVSPSVNQLFKDLVTQDNLVLQNKLCDNCMFVAAQLAESDQQLSVFYLCFLLKTKQMSAMLKYVFESKNKAKFFGGGVFVDGAQFSELLQICMALDQEARLQEFRPNIRLFGKLTPDQEGVLVQLQKALYAVQVENQPDQFRAVISKLIVPPSKQPQAIVQLAQAACQALEQVAQKQQDAQKNEKLVKIIQKLKQLRAQFQQNGFVKEFSLLKQGYQQRYPDAFCETLLVNFMAENVDCLYYVCAMFAGYFTEQPFYLSNKQLYQTEDPKAVFAGSIQLFEKVRDLLSGNVSLSVPSVEFNAGASEEKLRQLIWQQCDADALQVNVCIYDLIEQLEANKSPQLLHRLVLLVKYALLHQSKTAEICKQIAQASPKDSEAGQFCSQSTAFDDAFNHDFLLHFLQRGSLDQILDAFIAQNTLWAQNPLTKLRVDYADSAYLLQLQNQNFLKAAAKHLQTVLNGQQLQIDRVQCLLQETAANKFAEVGVDAQSLAPLDLGLAFIPRCAQYDFQNKLALLREGEFVATDHNLDECSEVVFGLLTIGCYNRDSVHLLLAYAFKILAETAEEDLKAHTDLIQKTVDQLVTKTNISQTILRGCIQFNLLTQLLSVIKEEAVKTKDSLKKYYPNSFIYSNIGSLILFCKAKNIQLEEIVFLNQDIQEEIIKIKQQTIQSKQPEKMLIGQQIDNFTEYKKLGTKLIEHINKYIQDEDYQALQQFIDYIKALLEFNLKSNNYFKHFKQYINEHGSKIIPDINLAQWMKLCFEYMKVQEPDKNEEDFSKPVFASIIMICLHHKKIDQLIFQYSAFQKTLNIYQQHSVWEDKYYLEDILVKLNQHQNTIQHNIHFDLREQILIKPNSQIQMQSIYLLLKQELPQISISNISNEYVETILQSITPKLLNNYEKVMKLILLNLNYLQLSEAFQQQFKLEAMPDADMQYVQQSLQSIGYQSQGTNLGVKMIFSQFVRLLCEKKSLLLRVCCLFSGYCVKNTDFIRQISQFYQPGQLDVGFFNQVRKIISVHDSQILVNVHQVVGYMEAYNTLKLTQMCQAYEPDMYRSPGQVEFRSVNLLIYEQLRQFHNTHDIHYLMKFVSIVNILVKLQSKSLLKEQADSFSSSSIIHKLAGELQKQQDDEFNFTIINNLIQQNQLNILFSKLLNNRYFNSQNSDRKYLYLSQKLNIIFLIKSIEFCQEIIRNNQDVANIINNVQLYRSQFLITEFIYAPQEDLQNPNFETVVLKNINFNRADVVDSCVPHCHKPKSSDEEFFESIETPEFPEEVDEAQMQVVQKFVDALLQTDLLHDSGMHALVDRFVALLQDEAQLIAKVYNQMASRADKQTVLCRGLVNYSVIAAFVDFLLQSDLACYYECAPIKNRQFLEQLKLKTAEVKFKTVQTAKLLHPTIPYEMEFQKVETQDEVVNDKINTDNYEQEKSQEQDEQPQQNFQENIQQSLELEQMTSSIHTEQYIQHENILKQSESTLNQCQTNEPEENKTTNDDIEINAQELPSQEIEVPAEQPPTQPTCDQNQFIVYENVEQVNQEPESQHEEQPEQQIQPEQQAETKQVEPIEAIIPQIEPKAEFMEELNESSSSDFESVHIAVAPMLAQNTVLTVVPADLPDHHVNFRVPSRLRNYQNFQNSFLSLRPKISIDQFGPLGNLIDSEFYEQPFYVLNQNDKVQVENAESHFTGSEMKQTPFCAEELKLKVEINAQDPVQVRICEETCYKSPKFTVVPDVCSNCGQMIKITNTNTSTFQAATEDTDCEHHYQEVDFIQCPYFQAIFCAKCVQPRYFESLTMETAQFDSKMYVSSMGITDFCYHYYTKQNLTIARRPVQLARNVLRSYAMNIHGCQQLSRVILNSESLVGINRYYLEDSGYSFSDLSALQFSEPNTRSLLKPLIDQFAKQFDANKKKFSTSFTSFITSVLDYKPGEYTLENKLTNAAVFTFIHVMFCKTCQRIPSICTKCGEEVTMCLSLENFIQCAKAGRKSKFFFCVNCLQICHSECLNSDNMCVVCCKKEK
ncbi:Conserved_hypothetical protein [Hexamita inflata]|uniref:Uncharacterized protein n=1 Tax=Hexamita inflata TaxID=28002 RepID=A0AA86Q702_9EUKA|nr:Conserved hypothetical protein [Hexamita inflata]CAI9959555.1 Conserved hypothetical protein [Hexamita inflata]